MALLLSCENLHLEYPTKKLFGSVTLGIGDGDRIGIVGRNGDGKSTLLSLLSGAILPDSGSVTPRNGLDIGVLGQTDSLDDEATVGHEIVGDTPEYLWASDPKVRGIISSLVGDIAWDAPIRSLSGGQRRRVDLARVLIGEHDVLMLDEPTNHLDVRGISWLANHLNHRWAGNNGALLVVTHDRWFLDEVCTRMWEVHDGTIDPFEGGYSAYVLQRVQREQAAQVAETKRQNAMRQELAWLSRGARARATKPKFHVEAAEAIIAEDPPTRDTLALKRSAISRLGKQVVDMTRVTKRYGTTTVIDDVTWLIGPGDRYGILGENGAGKTTLLRLIEGKLAPSAGRVKIGTTVKFATLSQQLEELAGRQDDTVREVLADYKTRYEIEGREVTPAQLLELLGFPSKYLNSRVGELSGGQRRRLQLMLILLDRPNVLVLDEPGNDLDTDMLVQLESLLDSWPGTLILVTHDRYLMERVTDDQFALVDGKVRHVPGGFDEYLGLLQERDHAREQAARNASHGAQHAAPPAAIARELRKNITATERKIGTLHSKESDIIAQQHAAAPTDYETLGDLEAKLQDIRQQISDLEDEWLELSEKLS